MKKKLFKEIEQGLKDLKEGNTIPYEDVKKEWQEEDKWLKKHPYLAKLKTLWWWIRYGIKNKIEELPGAVRRFIQRGKRGWAISDTWGFDYYLAIVIVEGLSYLRKNNNTVPMKTKFKPYSKKEWDNILNKIIKTFKLAIKKIDYKLLTKKEQKQYNEGWMYFRKFFFSLWD